MAQIEQKSHPFFPRSFLWLGMLIFSAANSVIAKLGHLGAMHLVDGRNPISFCNVLFAANIIAGFTLYGIHRKVWNKENLSKLTKKDWWNLLFLAVLSGVLSPTLFFLGLMLTEVINVVLLSVIDIPLTLIFAWWIIKEKPTLGGVLSSIFSIAGIAVIFLLHQSFMPSSMKMTMINLPDGVLSRFLATLPFAGGLCIIAATFLISFSVQYSKKVITTVPVGIFSVFRMIVGSIIFFIIVLALFGPAHFIDIFDPFLLEWMVFYGAVIIAFGLYIWYKGIQGTTTTDLSISNAFQPISGVIFAYFILQEIPDFGQIIGGIVIMLGIFIGLILQKKEAKKIEGIAKPRSFSGC